MAIQENRNWVSLTRWLLVLMCSVILIACGNRTIKPQGNERVVPEQPSAKSPPAATKPGGYYLDDGPGDNPPADIDSIPDAVPRSELLLPRASRPYSALGQRYTPMTEYVPYKQRGIASWYGRRYHGQKTSSGEIYDMYAMTGAHTILPLPSYARVTNPENGRSVIVRINDRGPFHSDRLIDLSYAAAYKLRLTGKGSGLVEVEAIDTRTVASARAAVSSATSNAKPAPTLPAEQTTSQAMPMAIDPNIVPPPTELPAPPSSAAGIGAAPNVAGAAVPSSAATEAGVYVQVGAFKNKDNAEQLSQKLRAQSLVENVPVNSWYNEGIHRVRIGPFANRTDADRIAGKIKQALHVNTYIINQP